MSDDHLFIYELDSRMRHLMDQDPVEAIAEARKLLGGNPNVRSVAAGVLIDAGAIVQDANAVQNGITVFRELTARFGNLPDLRYNLANGLVTLADIEIFIDIDWYLKTSLLRREARSLFGGVVSSNADEGLQSTAATNLANAFWKAHRWAEAYDAYIEALRYDPTNAIASTGAARVLLRCARFGLGDPSVLMAVAQRHIERSKVNEQRLRELGGARAHKELSKLFEAELPGGAYPDLSNADEYQRFVAHNRLALSPTIEGLDSSLKRWDSLQIRSLRESVSKQGIPPLFAMFNVMKADYLAARMLIFKSLHEKTPDSGAYSDTLDYAVYGVNESLLSLALRACIDLLDKIAVATSEYLGLSGKFIYFSTRWYGEKLKGGALQWHPELRDEILKGNTAMIALAELSLDIESGGALHENKVLRHASTHRFIVVHDIGDTPSRESPFVEHYGIGDFEKSLIRALQLTRAALLYFVDMVAQNEHEQNVDDKLAFPMLVPQHHEIRGDDE